MDKTTNQYINVAYQLYDVTDAQPELIEQTTADKPFDFITGFGIVLDDFEKQLMPLGKGESFEFELKPEQAYGEYVEARVIDLDKSTFCIDGKFDSNHIYPDAIVPLQNADGNRFLGHVVSISDDKVRIDLNHPLAGRTLKFKGHIIENREATNEEIEKFAKMLSDDGGCGGSCENCEKECGHHEGEDKAQEGCCGHHGDKHNNKQGGCCHRQHHQDE